MSRSVRLFQVDAFTDRRFAGNPAGVVLDAHVLTDEEMQALARETGHGDSAFVLPPDGPDHDLRVRFFNPRAEAAFVGHATVAVHAVLALLGLPPQPRQKQRTGIIEVHTGGTADAPVIGLRLPVPALKRHVGGAELAPVLEALQLAPTDLDPRFPPMIAGDTSTRVLLGVRDAAVLARAHADAARLAALSATLQAPGYFLFTTRTQQAGHDTESRMFCPALGIPEDPVSGNAHGLLGTYLLRYGALRPRDGVAAFTGAQGQSVGRPGTVQVVLELQQRTVRSIRISGSAVVVFEAQVAL